MNETIRLQCWLIILTCTNLHFWYWYQAFSCSKPVRNTAKTIITLAIKKAHIIVNTADRSYNLMFIYACTYGCIHEGFMSYIIFLFKLYNKCTKIISYSKELKCITSNVTCVRDTPLIQQHSTPIQSFRPVSDTQPLVGVFLNTCSVIVPLHWWTGSQYFFCGVTDGLPSVCIDVTPQDKVTPQHRNNAMSA